MYDKCYFCLDQLPKLKKESTASFFVNFGRSRGTKEPTYITVHIYQNLHDQWKLTKINQKQLESSQSNWNWIICLCIGAASVPDEVLNLFRSLPPISPSSPPPFSIDPNGGKLIRAKVGCTNGISWLANPPHSCQSSTGQVYLDSGFA